MPDIVKSIRESKLYVKRFMPLQFRNLTQVKNSVVTCRLCCGSESNGTIAIKSDTLQTMTVTKCWFCGGTREMSNRELSEGEQYKY